MANLPRSFIRKSLLAVSALALTGVAVPAAFAATSAKPAAAQSTYVKTAENSRPWHGDNAKRRNRIENRGARNANRGDRNRSSDRNRDRDRSDRNRNRNDDNARNRDRNRDQAENRRNRDRGARHNGHRNHDNHNRNRTVVRIDTGHHGSQRRRHVQPRPYVRPRPHVRHRPVLRHRPAVHNRRHQRHNRGHYTPYRSGLGISFHFGSPGYSQYRWASSPYSFYRASYGGYGHYQTRTTCRRVNIDGWHHGHRELVSVKQCSNPWDGTYIVQGSERVIACRW